MTHAPLRVIGVLAALWVACQCGVPPPPECVTAHCFRAIRCVETCGGAASQVGCCPCPDGTFDDVTCSADAGDGG